MNNKIILLIVLLHLFVLPACSLEDSHKKFSFWYHRVPGLEVGCSEKVRGGSCGDELDDVGALHAEAACAGRVMWCEGEEGKGAGGGGGVKW